MYEPNDEVNKDAFNWIFKPLSDKPDRFYILNQHYKEPLYTGSWVSNYCVTKSVLKF